MAKIFANSGDLNQMLHSGASDLDLHCLQFTLLWGSRLKWLNQTGCIFKENKLI